MDLPQRLIADIQDAGYYPQIAATAIAEALLDEPVLDHLVYTDTHMDLDTIHRLVSVFVLTPTRLVLARVDDEPHPEPGWSEPRALCSTEEVELDKLAAPAIFATYADPAHYRPGEGPVEVQLVMSWGARSRLEVFPENCGNPDCDVDHGFSGGTFSEDVALRVSAQAEGQQAVDATVSFANTLRRVIHAARTQRR